MLSSTIGSEKPTIFSVGRQGSECRLGSVDQVYFKYLSVIGMKTYLFVVD